MKHLKIVTLKTSKRMPAKAIFLALFLTINASLSVAVRASSLATAAPEQAVSSDGTRYGLFDWLDHRSAYGQGAFPEPFLVDDSDLEVNEARFDWLHTKSESGQSDLVTGEVEKGFGLLTLEVEVPFERDTSFGVDPTTGQGANSTVQGMSNVDLGARYPFYQFVSSGGLLDATFGAAIEVGIPTNSPVSKNTEVVPKVFADLKLGDHFTLQSILGYSMLYGGGDEGGLHTFEYGFVLGYTIPHEQLPLVYVQQFIPVFELSGETELNKDNPGHNSLLGNLGFRLNLKTMGQVQPRLGLGFIFPVDQGAREDVHQGIVTSLIFEY
jgi:hypothetical protein